MSQDIFNIETLGEALRPEETAADDPVTSCLDAERRVEGGSFRLSRDERDYVAGHALGSIQRQSEELIYFIEPGAKGDYSDNGSTCARKIAALSNLLGDIGWARHFEEHGPEASYVLGELFPTAQLRPWLEKWVEKDTLASKKFATHDGYDKLGTGIPLLARLEKWMASRGN